MALVKTSHTLADKRRLERLSDEAASGAGLTLLSTSSSAGKNADRAWQLKSVHVLYSAAVTLTTTIKIISALGSQYDEVLPSIVLSAEAEGSFRPTEQLCFNADDQIEVVNLAEGGQTNIIEVKRELL